METKVPDAIRSQHLPDAQGVCRTLYVNETRVAAVQAAMPGAESLARITETFAVLSDPTRLRILFALSLHELCVCDLAKIADRSMPATSHQLQLLRKQRLVTFRMEGKLAYYTLASPQLRELIEDAVGRAGEREAP